MTLSKEDLKSKIIQLFPEIDQYGLELDVERDESQDAWLARVKKNENELATHLDEKDVEECLAGVKCYNLGIQLGQFIRHYCEGGESCTLGL